MDETNNNKPSPGLHNPNAVDNLVIPGRKYRAGPGRPKGSTTAFVQAKRVAAAKVKLVTERAAELGLEAISAERVPLEQGAPERTVTQAKEAALRLLNSMLWTLEKRVEANGVNEYDEQRLLKLLAGLNAALPKTAEVPIKDPSEMSEEELRKVAGK